MSRRITRRNARRNDGYALLVVLLVLSLFVLALAKLVPDWKTQIQREREARMIDHAREYRIAIKRYFHKNGRYPPSLDILIQKDGQGVRYLRQAWVDPLSPGSQNTGSAAADSGDTALAGSSAAGQAGSTWQVLHYGQAVKAEIVDQPPAAALAASGLGSPIAGPALSGVAAGSSGSSSSPTSPFAAASSPLAASGSNSGIAASAAAPSGLQGVTSGPGSGIGGANGSGVAAGPVIGVASFSKRPAVHSFNGFDIPNDWQFVYDYSMDPSLRVGAPTSTTGAGLAPPAAASTSTTGSAHP